MLVEGIEKVTAADIRFANELNYRIKLLASIKADDAGEIEVRVVPTLIPKSHVLASVNGVFNAVAVRGDVVGDALFYGRGAGQDPTSSSVLADLAEAAAFLSLLGPASASLLMISTVAANRLIKRFPNTTCALVSKTVRAF